MPEKASFQGYFTEVSWETSYHIFKMAIFQKNL
jgi:hypothetical protein